jgi:hypothetical protein
MRVLRRTEHSACLRMAPQTPRLDLEREPGDQRTRARELEQLSDSGVLRVGRRNVGTRQRQVDGAEAG